MQNQSRLTKIKRSGTSKNNCIFETKGVTSMIKYNFLARVCIVYYITEVHSLYIAGHGI